MTDVLKWTGEPLSISNSEIQLFKDCRLTWYLTYYRKLRLRRAYAEVAGARSLGTRIHATLDAAYTTDVSPLLTLKSIYEADMESLKASITDNDQFLEESMKAIEKEFKLANTMIAGWVDWIEENGIDDGLEIVAVEDVIMVKSHIEGVFWKGKLDQRVERKIDGARLFRDWKTVQSVTEPAKMLVHDEQMKFYHLLEYLDALQSTGSEPQWRTDGALYFMLRKVGRTANAKPPFYGQLEVHHNMTTIRNMYKRVAKVTEEIVQTRLALDAGGDFQYLCPPRPNRDWTWKNDFFPVMSLIDDGSDYEGFLAEYYEVGNPDERYEQRVGSEE